jgi:hypothetical protein
VAKEFGQHIMEELSKMVEAHVFFDNENNIYLFGGTKSTEQISTEGSYQSEIGSIGRADGFIVKFNLKGIRQWGTYYGGSAEENINSAIQDNNGNIYITGSTRSSDSIATAGVWQENRGIGFDAFLAKFDSNGNRLWGTYFGGENHDYAFGVCIDQKGDIYVAGNTLSKNNIASDSAHQIQYEGPNRSFWGGDAFLAKFDSSGSRLWSTYYGGSEGEIAYSCVVDDENYVYLVGGTNSTNNISSEGVHQTLLNNTEYNIPSNPPGDGFIAKFNPEGKRIWGTYFGSDSTDLLYCGCYDDSGYLYFGGYSRSPQGIATPRAHRTEFIPPWDVLLIKMDKDGELHWATYFGGDGSRVYSCVSDNIGHVYITGRTGAPKNFSTEGAHQEKYGGRGDAFLAKFDARGRFPVSVPEVQVEGSSFLVYPNPARDEINIQYPHNSGNNFQIQFIDAQGRIVFSLPRQETKINTTDWSQGIYFLKIQNLNNYHYETHKIIISR